MHPEAYSALSRGPSALVVDTTAIARPSVVLLPVCTVIAVVLLPVQRRLNSRGVALSQAAFVVLTLALVPIARLGQAVGAWHHLCRLLGISRACGWTIAATGAQNPSGASDQHAHRLP